MSERWMEVEKRGRGQNIRQHEELKEERETIEGKNKAKRTMS